MPLQQKSWKGFQNEILGSFQIMPRQPRLDAPGTLHHVMGRGIGVQKYSGRIQIGRISFLNLEGFGEDGIPGAEVAGFLSVTTSAVICPALDLTDSLKLGTG